MYLHYLYNLPTYQYLTYLNYTCTLPYLYLLPCLSSPTCAYQLCVTLTFIAASISIFFLLHPLKICPPVHLPVQFLYLSSLSTCLVVHHLPESSIYVSLLLSHLRVPCLFFFLIIFSLKYYLPSLPACLLACYLYNFPLFL